MERKVIRRFRDKHSDKLYEKNNVYSHKGDSRIAELVEKGFLEEGATVKEEQVKHVGGGWYELPNGEKVKGKTEALAALESGE